MAAVFITHAQGYFEEQGLDVELVPLHATATSIPALARGQLDVLPGPMSPSLFNAIHRGAPIRIVSDKGSFTKDGCSHNAFIVSPEVARAEGKIALKRASWGREPFMQFAAERAVEHLGYDVDEIDLTFVPNAARYDAVVSGRLDGGLIGEPRLTHFRRQGGAVWAETNEVLPGHQISVYAFGPRLLEEDPELGRRVSIALLKGVRQYNRGKTPENLRILAEALDWDLALLQDVCWPPMRDDGLINAESIREFQEWALERGDLDAVLPAERYWAPSFVEHARSVLDAAR